MIEPSSIDRVMGRKSENITDQETRKKRSRFGGVINLKGGTGGQQWLAAAILGVSWKKLQPGSGFVWP